MSKYLKRKLHKRANMKQILSAKENQETLLKNPIELVLEDVEIEDYCKKNIQIGIKTKNFELVKQSLELCETFCWYKCNGNGNKCPLLENRIETFKDLVNNKEHCLLFKKI